MIFIGVTGHCWMRRLVPLGQCEPIVGGGAVNHRAACAGLVDGLRERRTLPAIAGPGAGVVGAPTLPPLRHFAKCFARLCAK
jgi:hypothetical protein